MNFAETIMTLPHPSVTYGHFQFLNFPSLGYNASPTYYNTMRDPFDQFVSYFGFKRSPWIREPPGYKREDINDCILRNRTECTTNVGKYFQVVSVFSKENE